MFILLAIKNDTSEIENVRVMGIENNTKDINEMLQFLEDNEQWPEGFEAMIINTAARAVWFVQ